MTKLKIFGKWTVLVWLNAAFSFFIAYTSRFDSLPEVLGLVCGVFTFVALYSVLDCSLLKQNKQSLRKWLLIGVLIKAATQCLPSIQVITGMIAVSCVDAMFSPLSEANNNARHGTSSLSSRDSFLGTYSATILDGILLSIVVFALVMLIKLVATKVIPYFKKPKPVKAQKQSAAENQPK